MRLHADDITVIRQIFAEELRKALGGSSTGHDLNKVADMTPKERRAFWKAQRAQEATK